MRDVIAVVFDKHDDAYTGLHDLWRMDEEGEVTVHKAGVALRNSYGDVVVETSDGDPPLGTAIGLAAGALLGMLAGPAGAAVGAAGGAAIGAATGGLVGLGVDASKADTADQAVQETGTVLRKGQHAVMADVDEETYAPIDARMKLIGGKVYRRDKAEVAADKWNELDPYLIPYDYDPVVAADAV
ncbi:MAG TPA: hypothetical protein VKF82_02945 [Candidatus Eremiobacteraceae bacterium]|nr:hypothetical protein [Candidatus Eremiobacteraceae bacterium]